MFRANFFLVASILFFTKANWLCKFDNVFQEK